MIDNDLRKTVFVNLDCAAESGYFEPGEYLDGYDANDIAQDMVLLAGDCEDQEWPTLVPFVQEWLDRRKTN